ncbi:hypothetical protein [Mongoliibacter ruber]|uniref:Uncharacterized protein n=1 Tax=Mongoliibacter ruber TaxID=1750599 RepID=A0A2T0WPG5_9BACT|nr:hypothetical protein [Mongoliibacter ruber]PRY88593.1 hypothetical protein CLW00_104244 [Mongoliibacter ruber]
MKRLTKEVLLFVFFAYLSVWIVMLVLFLSDLRSSSLAISQIEEIFLIQLSIVYWFSSLILLYVLRLLLVFLFKKFSLTSNEGAP